MPGPNGKRVLQRVHNNLNDELDDPYYEKRDQDAQANIPSPVYCAEVPSEIRSIAVYRLSGLLSRETIDDDQATWLADGMQIIVGILTSLEKEHPKH